MKAAVFNEYGSPDVLHITDVEAPTPKDNEIRVKVHATSVTFGDLMVRKMNTITPGKFTMPAPLWLPTRLMFGFNKPKINILGAEFAGKVDTIGKDVTRFKVGDEVFGYLGMWMGANAEYVCLKEDISVTHKPQNMSYVEAAAIPYGAIMGVPALRKANIQPGQKVLINGASGSIGSCILQVAKHYGAEVTGVCGTPRLDMVKALGADHVIDYTKEDFTQNGEKYVVIVDILGKRSYGQVKNSLTENGIFLLTSFKVKHVLQMLWTSRVGSKKVICALSPESVEDLEFARDLIEAGEMKTVVDRCYPLAETAEAHRYIESGKKTGEVIIAVTS